MICAGCKARQPVHTHAFSYEKLLLQTYLFAPQYQMTCAKHSKEQAVHTLSYEKLLP